MTNDVKRASGGLFAHRCHSESLTVTLLLVTARTPRTSCGVTDVQYLDLIRANAIKNLIRIA